MQAYRDFQEVFDGVPMSDDHRGRFAGAQIGRVSVNPESRAMRVELRLGDVVAEGCFAALEDGIKSAFPFIETVWFDRLYHLPQQAGEDLLGRHWDNIVYRVNAHSPICGHMLKTARRETGEGGVALFLENPFLFERLFPLSKLRAMLGEALGADMALRLEREAPKAEKAEDAPVAAYIEPSAVVDKKPEAKWQGESREKRGFKARKRLDGAPIKLAEHIEQDEEILIEGEILKVEIKETKSGKLLVLFDVTDGGGSISAKIFLKPEQFDGELRGILAKGEAVRALGSARYDTYSKELVLMVNEIAPAQRREKAGREDTCGQKRVELHLHTNMSQMDATNAIGDFVAQAAKWGHSAIAVTDHGVVQAFPDAMKAAAKHGVKMIYGCEAYLLDDTVADIGKAKYRHAVILVKNRVGLRNLYELVSKAHLDYFANKRPRIPKSELTRLREGLIVGSACEAGELYTALRTGKPEEEVKRIADYYDYFEIQPIGNNMFMVRDNLVPNVDRLRELNREVAALGERLGKPVVATCDAHFLNPEDEVYRRILQAGTGFKDADSQPPLFFRTTDEMLEEFGYLGAEKAYEVVVTNTNLINDMIEAIKPVPEGAFPPQIDGAEEDLRRICYERAGETYGEELPAIVADRLERELDSIIGHGFAVLYIIAQKLVRDSEEHGYLVGSRGSVGSSFAATMAGITEVNPLPPHYYCGACKFSDFESEGVLAFAGGSGCDMPDRVCPVCGEPLKKDGHDIPFETFLGFDGDKEPDIDLNFSGEYQANAHAYTRELLGAEYVFKAGTIGTLAEKTAFGYVKKYLEERGRVERTAEIDRLAAGCTGVKKTTGQHPGGLVVVPRGHSIYEFCPVQRPANDMKSDVITTAFDYHSALEGRLFKLDELGHDMPTVMRMLHDMTGIDPRTVDLGDKAVMSLFTSADGLGVTAEAINSKTGTLGLPEFGTVTTRRVLMDASPACFADLARISGITHGEGIWKGNAQDLIRSNVTTLEHVISTRDDIMRYLISMGVERKSAFKIMESVRKGRGVNDEQEAEMLAAGVPEWYVDSCRKIKYMFPKGHAVAYVMMAVRMAWFKIHHPYAFYAALFSVKATDFDYVLMCQGEDASKAAMKRLEGLGDEATAKDEGTRGVLESVLEFYARGLSFVPMDLYKSSAMKFKAVDGGLLPPLITLQGLGEAVAAAIEETRKEKDFFSVEEFKERTKTNKSVVDLLKENRILDGVPDSAQVTLF